MFTYREPTNRDMSEADLVSQVARFCGTWLSGLGARGSEILDGNLSLGAMLPQQPVLGSPGVIDRSDGLWQCTPLARSSMHGGESQHSEHFLQELISDCPSLLPVKDFLPSAASVFSLAREVQIDVGGQSGYIDNLLVTNEGWLVLVETKLWRNPQSTREVIAQILQYGMALSALSISELESKLRLPTGKTIAEYLTQEQGANLIDDFDDALERHLRQGELLYLIVSDGIRVSVQRISHWLNEGGSAPFKFGLIELRFFDAENCKLLVVPRSLVKSREISRHVVVVDIRGPSAHGATATVRDLSRDQASGGVLAQRVVRLAGPPMTKVRLFAELTAKKRQAEALIATKLIERMEAEQLHSRSTPGNLQFGVLSAGDDDATFYALISFNLTGAWSHLPANVIQAVGDEEFVAHKRRMNMVAGFYRPHEATNAAKRSTDLVPAYLSLRGKEDELARAIGETREVVARVLSGE